jgi:hypothetical protein
MLKLQTHFEQVSLEVIKKIVQEAEPEIMTEPARPDLLKSSKVRRKGGKA